MTSVFLLGPFIKTFGQWQIQMLVVLLIFPGTTDKDSSFSSLYSNESQQGMAISGGYIPISYCHSQTSRLTSHLLCYRLQHLCKISFYFTIGLNRLSLNITLRMILGSQLFDSYVKQEDLEHHDLIIGYPRTGMQKELIVLRSFQSDYLLHIGSVPITSPFFISVIIWIYRYHLVTAPCKASDLFTWRNHLGIRSRTPSSYTMLPLFVIVSLAAMGISTVMGLLTNVFIILAHGMDRTKGRNTNPKELIMLTLGLFNIAFQCTMAANDTFLFLCSDLYFTDSIYAAFSVLLLFTIFSSFWLTFCLCGFYYIMLITSEQTFFIHLKQDISKVVCWMLVTSILLSLAISIPVVWNISKDDQSHQLQGNLTYNSTLENSIPHMKLQYLLVTSIVGCCVPLILVSVSNVLIIKSLCLHANRTGKNTNGLSVHGVEASVSAARTVTSLLLLYISFYISEIVLLMNVFEVDSPWTSVCLVAVYSYPPVQSVILILGSPRLKDMMIRILCVLRLPVKMPPTDQTETISSSVSTL